MDTWNLALGLLGGILWSAVLVRAFQGAVFGTTAAAAFVVAMATVNVILIFGSLRLLAVLSDDLWNLVGTGGRAVFDVCAIVALLDSQVEGETA